MRSHRRKLRPSGKLALRAGKIEMRRHKQSILCVAIDAGQACVFVRGQPVAVVYAWSDE